ncbi:hypothetical protein HK097_007867 [Rhizophlyctis rosea]|uniref:DNA-directed RNA polymerase III subunit RPC4 n=1 Tax=Rhizophlyctis rosea TaxID=64517 RepID=A0AAD5X1D7_9FUNG|nr:hypothetical protein HK097_007867 [Rhizophlyctis rosea]
MSGGRRLVKRGDRQKAGESTESGEPSAADIDLTQSDAGPSNSANPTPAPAPAPRLGSLRGSRLAAASASASASASSSSGAAAQPKFVPKAPVRRRKAEVTEEPKEDAFFNQPSAGRGRGRGRGRGQRPKMEEMMVASGPFALGPAARGASAVSAPSRGGGGGGFDAVAARRKPINKDEMFDIKDESGEAMEIDGQFEDDSADVGFDPADIWSPVSLGGPQHLMKKEEAKKERKIKIKPEPGGPSPAPIEVDDYDAINLVDEKPVTSFPEETGTDELYFFQFPAVLPQMENPNNNVMEIDDGPGQASESGANGTGVVKADPDAAPKTSTGPEGKVGKLVFYKSGKCKLKIGDIYFDIAPGSESNFLQNVASIDTAGGKIHLLGNLTKRFVCTPDIEMLLNSV